MMSDLTELSLEENNLMGEVGEFLGKWKTVARKRIRRKSFHVKEGSSTYIRFLFILSESLF